MLNDQYRSVINIVNAGILGKTVSLGDNFDLSSLYSLAKNHQIFGIVFSGVSSLGISSDLPIYKKLFSGALSELVFHEEQSAVLKCLFEEFNNKNISYMPLKGSELKKLYPKPELRVMSDADILIKLAEYDKISSILNSQGFVYEYESDHEIVWKKDRITIELHKHLIPSYNRRLYAYFGTGWSHAFKTNDGYYKMNENDEFIFVFTHFAKHYRDGGVGIKQLLDIKLMLSNYDIDLDYVKAKLKELRLDVFFANVQNALNVWFDDQISDEVSDLIISTIIKSGAYGTATNRENANSLRANGGHKVGSKRAKISVLRKKLFPPVSSLKERYNCLNKAPFLLPIVWICRIVSVPFRKKSLTRNLEDYNKTSSEQTVTMEKSLKLVGLDFK